MPKLNENYSHRTSNINFTDDDISYMTELANRLKTNEIEEILVKVKTIKQTQDKNREKARQWAIKNKEKRNARRKELYKQNKLNSM